MINESSGLHKKIRGLLFTSRELSLIIILSAIGGVISIPIGYLSNFITSIPFLPFGISQIFSGLHVFWIVIASVMVNKKGVGTITGVLKGLVELFLISFHGIFVFPISVIEGVILDSSLLILKRDKNISLCIAGGFSSASNVFILQVIVLPKLPMIILAFMYSISFVSGFIFTGIFVEKIFDTIKKQVLK